jgi:hypothetical protein
MYPVIIARMHDYLGLKRKSNASPNAHRFGKIKFLGPSVPQIVEYSVIWMADIGYSFRRAIRIEDRSSQIEHEFISNQNENRYKFDRMITFLHSSPGLFYNIQCGGCSNVQLLVKVPNVDTNEDLLAWNALRFLHLIGWVPSTGSDVSTVMNIPSELNSIEVKWIDSLAQKALVQAIPVLDINWVWFRRAGYRLTQEIMERATSWIIVNPDCRFHLWTDIPNHEQLDDFLSLLKPEWRERFVSKVTIHMANETNEIVETVLTELTDKETEESIALLRSEFGCPERQARVYKTDFARLFILYKRGGVYADFNDLLCLAPIRDLMAIYGIDKPLGVTDLADLNHASNYFMYCPTESREFFDATKGMVKDIKYLVRMMRDSEMEALVKTYVYKALESCKHPTLGSQDITELHTMFNRQQLPYVGNESISASLWERILFVILVDCAPAEFKACLDARLTEMKRPARARAGRRTALEFKALNDEEVALITSSIEEKYHASFLFWWTDYNLRTLMHFTNLPIYCRMRKIPLSLVPYGYFMSYSCMLSWFGHIGDGTSYGMDGRKDVRVADLYNIS